LIEFSRGAKNARRILKIKLETPEGRLTTVVPKISGSTRVIITSISSLFAIGRTSVLKRCVCGAVGAKPLYEPKSIIPS